MHRRAFSSCRSRGLERFPDDLHKEARPMMTWTYHDANRVPVFQHYRMARRPTPDDPRRKKYGYRYPENLNVRISASDGWTWRKPELADATLFRLPVVLAQPDRTLVLTEGERDCLEFVQRRVLASC